MTVFAEDIIIITITIIIISDTLLTIIIIMIILIIIIIIIVITIIIIIVITASPQASSTLIFGLPVVPWAPCLVVYCMRTISFFVCHDDFEQAYVQQCRHNLDAYFLVRLCRARVVSRSSSSTVTTSRNKQVIIRKVTWNFIPGS